MQSVTQWCHKVTEVKTTTEQAFQALQGQCFLWESGALFAIAFGLLNLADLVDAKKYMQHINRN